MDGSPDCTAPNEPQSLQLRGEVNLGTEDGAAATRLQQQTAGSLTSRGCTPEWTPRERTAGQVTEFTHRGDRWTAFVRTQAGQRDVRVLIDTVSLRSAAAGIDVPTC